MEHTVAFKTFTSIRQAMSYAKTLPKVGSGSSRRVFDLGNGFVVKVAKNRLGYIQNEYETILSDDYYAQDLVNPVTEYSSKFLWVIAKKLKPVDFDTFFSTLGDRQDLMDIIKSAGAKTKCNIDFWDDTERPLVKELWDLVANYDFDYYLDVAKRDSWGLTESGQLKLVDYGLKKAI